MIDSDMNAYVCVYRHPIPHHRDWHLTELAADSKDSNSMLRRYLNAYDDQNSFYDWGDDPSFFCAGEILGDVRKATWGVCRPNVRKGLKAGDYVVFFCAKSAGGPVWEYFYIGVGTASRALKREDIWSNDHYAEYRTFFNILARLSHDVLEQHEIIYSFHKDWKQRCKAPYWLFDHEQAQFNLVNPLHVATYTGEKGAVETWHSSQNQQVAALEEILFPKVSSSRRLRTRNYQRPNIPINLRKHLGPSTDLNTIRSQLMELATCSS